MDDSKQNSKLSAFLDADWKLLTGNLLIYAQSCVRSYYWRVPESLPKGLEIEDVVGGAIEKTLAGIKAGIEGSGYRHWDPSCDDLDAFLKNVIDSDVYNLVYSAAHRRNRYDTKQQIENGEGVINDLPGDDDPETNLIAAEIASQQQEYSRTFLEKLHKSCEPDGEETLCLLAMEELAETDKKISNISVAAISDSTPTAVRNTRRRIARKARRILETLNIGGELNE